ncbi:MAG: hypothetical protein IM542_21155 [Pseudanabaena sp. M165S2SP1A06QC]|nr:hypothetical protein [Pseudanabaena sp. M165S2SP1A06QC]
MLQTDKEALDQSLDNLQKINELEEKIKTLEKQPRKIQTTRKASRRILASLRQI